MGIYFSTTRFHTGRPLAKCALCGGKHAIYHALAHDEPRRRWVVALDLCEVDDRASRTERFENRRDAIGFLASEGAEHEVGSKPEHIVAGDRAVEHAYSNASYNYTPKGPKHGK